MLRYLLFMSVWALLVVGLTALIHEVGTYYAHRPLKHMGGKRKPRT